MIIRKIMLLGEMGVGKTSILNRLLHDRFSAEYSASIGVDLHEYEVRPSPAAEPFLFYVWDTDGSYGEAIFKSVYIKGAEAALVVGDVTRRATMETMAGLALRFEAALPGRYCRCVLNKVDLIQDGGSPELPEAMRRAGLPHIVTSARTGHNVTAAFHEAAATIVRRGQ